MWETEFKAETKALPEAVWSVWRDVENWKQWDEQIQYSRLNGPFEAGTSGTLKPRGGPTTKFVLLEVSVKGFSDRSFLPLCHFDFIHEVRSSGGVTSVLHRARMTGLLSPLFARIIGHKVERELPNAVTQLCRLAESRG